MARIRNAQNTKKCAMPGTVHLSSFRWPNTSTTWVLDRAAEPLGDVLDPVGRRLAAGDQPVEEQHPPAGERQGDRRQQQADDQHQSPLVTPNPTALRRNLGPVDAAEPRGTSPGASGRCSREESVTDGG